MKRKWILLICAATVCGLALLSWTAVDELKLLYSTVKADETRIDFYGVVRDQHGNPVENVKMCVGIKYAKLLGDDYFAIKRLNVMTNVDGEFFVENEQGTILFLSGLEKDGYDCRGGFLLSGTRFDYASKARFPDFKQILPNEKGNPAVFVIRKLGATTHLLIGTGAIKLTEAALEGQAYLCKKSGDSSPPQSMYQKLPTSWPAIKAQVQMDTGKPETWTVTFSSTNEGGKVRIVDERQYQADDVESYTDTATLDLRLDKSASDRRKVFLMVSTAKPKTYSRVELEISAAEKSKPAETSYCRISFNSVTNPYGEMVLEEDPNLKKTSNVRCDMDNAAWASFLKGVNPEKPNVPKLIADELARRAAEEAEDEEESE